jgi:dihydroorotate dehydrogenase (fumarate)
MIDLSTDYLGLRLKNPLVPSASPLSRHLDSLLQLEDAGAAAVVLHSLYEEEVIAGEELPEGYQPNCRCAAGALERYLEHLRRAKARLAIPVVASLNGVTPAGWVTLGKQLQDAGADALELNVYYVVADPLENGYSVEARYLALLAELRRVVTIPVAMKLSPFFSCLPHFVERLEKAGAAGVALFNRFYQPDIDLDKLAMVDRLDLSTPEEALLRIRWIAILRGQTTMTLAATGGVHGAEEVLKLLLAGADVVHLASCLLKYGPARLGEILREVEEWMAARGFESAAQIKGRLCLKNLPDPSAVTRQSYIRVLGSFTPRSGG